MGPRPLKQGKLYRQTNRYPPPVRERTPGPLRVALYLHNIQEHMGGGSVAMWNLMEALADRGCEVTIGAAAQSGIKEMRGYKIHRRAGSLFFRAPDLILTGAGSIPRTACNMARQSGSRARVVSFVHSVTRDLKPYATGLFHIVWASAAMRSYALRDGGPPVPDSVLWPIIYPERVRVTPGEKVTLVNMLPEKGADLFWRLAKAMPDTQFLAVRGGWRMSDQVIPAKVPPNVEVLPFQTDAREVFRRTRILLYPKGRSAGPGWMHGVGMTALEAAVSGIPTIAYPGPGLVESLGDAGTYAKSTDPKPWVEAIRRLSDEDTYREASERAAARAAAVLDVDSIVDAVLALAPAIEAPPEEVPCVA